MQASLLRLGRSRLNVNMLEFGNVTTLHVMVVHTPSFSEGRAITLPRGKSLPIQRLLVNSSSTFDEKLLSERGRMIAGTGC